MKQYWFSEKISILSDNPSGHYYLASDVDARIAELEKALRTALEHVDERETAREWFAEAQRSLMER